MTRSIQTLAKHPRHRPVHRLRSGRDAAPVRWAALLGALVGLLLSGQVPAAALDLIVMQRDDRQLRVEGKVIVEAADGGLLLMTADGAYWTVQPDDIRERRTDDRPFEPLTADELGEELLNEMPPGFHIHTTAHYVICYNTSREYAQWCGALYERLYRAFYNFWTRKGLDLHEPEVPLVALVFAGQRSYQRYARDDLGDAVDSVVGYYSLRTNRVTMYDLTGLEKLRRPGARRDSAEAINRLLNQPAAEPLVATIIHEATHQLAFNCGLQTRYSDIPLWLSEGIALYFETPDLGSSQGWRGIGAVNRSRLTAFRRSLRARQEDSLKSLIATDERLRNVRTAAAAYAEAWALNYFLIRQHQRQYIGYLKSIAAKKPLVWDKPEQRIQQFREHFGEDLKQLDAELVRSTLRLR